MKCRSFTILYNNVSKSSFYISTNATTHRSTSTIVADSMSVFFAIFIEKTSTNMEDNEEFVSGRYSSSTHILGTGYSIYDSKRAHATYTEKNDVV